MKKIMNLKRIGKVQVMVYLALVEHGSYTNYGSWTWSSRGGTEDLMNRLVDRGLAVREDIGGDGMQWDKWKWRPVFCAELIKEHTPRFARNIKWG